mmetsp:Transcript_6731/g.18025  ORF Transcript_6731/g.18025 Transcript_6731/m.18025 type:complete len:429 (-) Transcript_6731:2125-3411(-)
MHRTSCIKVSSRPQTGFKCPRSRCAVLRSSGCCTTASPWTWSTSCSSAWQNSKLVPAASCWSRQSSSAATSRRASLLAPTPSLVPLLPLLDIMPAASISSSSARARICNARTSRSSAAADKPRACAMNDAKSPASDPARSSHTKVVTPPGGAPFAFAPPPDFRVCITLLSSSAALPTLLAAASSSCSCSCCACCRCCSSSGVNTGLGAREGVVGRKKGAASGFLGGCKGLLRALMASKCISDCHCARGSKLRVTISGASGSGAPVTGCLFCSSAAEPASSSISSLLLLLPAPAYPSSSSDEAPSASTPVAPVLVLAPLEAPALAAPSTAPSPTFRFLPVPSSSSLLLLLPLSAMLSLWSFPSPLAMPAMVTPPVPPRPRFWPESCCNCCCCCCSSDADADTEGRVTSTGLLLWTNREGSENTAWLDHR